VQRGIPGVALVLVVASSAVAGISAGPNGQARAYLIKCRTALKAANLGPVTKQTVFGEKRRVATARSACSASAKLKALADAYPADLGVRQAADAEAGIADGLVNYAKYLADIAAGKTGHTKILNYSLEEIRQAKLLLAEALAELK
jgi:hypothetical protein